MAKKLDGRIVVLPSKTANGDYIPGVIVTHQVRGENFRKETAYQPRYSFLPDELSDDLKGLFDAGKLSPPLAVSIDVEDRAGVFHKVTRIRKQ